MSARNVVGLAAAAAALSLVPGGAQAQAQTGSPAKAAAPDSAALKQQNLHYRFRLLGVYDESTGAPIAGAQVNDMMTGAGSATSPTGTVSLFFLPDGGGFVRIRKVGYEMQTIPVSISPTDTTPITIILQKATQLPTVSVTDTAPRYKASRLQAVEDRINAHAGGYFITETEMRKWDSSNMADMLVAKLNGIHNVPGPHGETYFASSRTVCKNALGGCNNSNCYANVWIDGVKIYDATNTPPAARPDFARLQTQDYTVVEFYPGGATVPPEFGGSNATCGVILLWSRER